MCNTHIDLLNVKVRLVTVSFFFSCLSGHRLISVFWGFCVLFFLNKVFLLGDYYLFLSHRPAALTSLVLKLDEDF